MLHKNKESVSQQKILFPRVGVSFYIIATIANADS